ncbi:sugar phosphate isomerase/epimerase [Arthrobacter ginkgonis]|uniref:Sugar phosphate isomerase/epimerase n=1 Tax=Arthrobacter ginkgonis TaxID=1630594 RepID=A0ABP7CXJ9_9MICC
MRDASEVRPPALIGADSTKFPFAEGKDAAWILHKSVEYGLDGVYFRSVLDLSPTLDRAQLRDVAAQAKEAGLWLEAGIGKVNPFSTPEAPGIRALGQGDYLKGMSLLVEAAAEAGVHELWSATANYQFTLPAPYSCDRFRTDVPWTDQLRATARFLHRLAPVLRDHGSHVNLETHEEITSFEVVRLVEEVGPDVLGITFDTANVLVRCEDPVAAARRVAPYVRATHVRDVALTFTDAGISRFLMPVGQGCLSWPEVISPLLERSPMERPLMLSIEGVTRSRAEMTLPLYDPVWQQGHPDLTAAEALAVVHLARRYGDRADRGEAPDLKALRAPLQPTEPLDFLFESVRHLRKVLDSLAARRETKAVAR